jgi:stage V sporulation protein SpoVS
VPQQPGAIADALDCLMDASLAASMGARGQTLVARSFSATAVARRWIECYQAIGREQAVPA